MRDPLRLALLSLTFVTGIVDAAAFLGLGQVFAAMMTGNVLFLGFGIAGSAGASVLGPLVGVLAFLAGGIAGGLAASRSATPPRALRWGVAIEVALLAAAVCVSAAAEVRPDEVSGYAVIALLAGAMGARNTNVRRIGMAELPTTVLTVAVTSLAAGTSAVGASGDHLVTRGAAIASMLAGAVTGALLLEGSLELALGAAAVVSLATGIAFAAAAPGPPDREGASG